MEKGFFYQIVGEDEIRVFFFPDYDNLFFSPSRAKETIKERCKIKYNLFRNIFCKISFKKAIAPFKERKDFLSDMSWQYKDMRRKKVNNLVGAIMEDYLPIAGEVRTINFIVDSYGITDYDGGRWMLPLRFGSNRDGRTMIELIRCVIIER